ncbi:MAG: TIGR01212 family radical SAM protein [Bacteroidales bacterium]|nr:MAG: TIGR01212 family radical SAM protein [Bacteroidales bacterium]
MTERKYSWGHHRRFNAYSNYFIRQFGERIQKVSIDAGFTCPNRDGSIGYGGCSYCNNEAFNPSYCRAGIPVSEQVRAGIEFHKTRYRKASKYLAYFQAYSNTYASLEDLKKKYHQALNVPEIVGLVIGTRPDCVDEEKLDYFSKLSEQIYLIIEYGIESCYNETLVRINRGHTFEKSVEAIEETAKRNIRTGAHLIFGLPGETRQQMIDEARIISGLPLNNVKFHQLQIIKGTRMEAEFKTAPSEFNLFTWDEYLEFLIEFLEYLNPEFVVERFTGEAPPALIVGPRWFKKRTDEIMSLFEEKLEELDTWQGKKYIT